MLLTACARTDAGAVQGREANLPESAVAALVPTAQREPVAHAGATCLPLEPETVVLTGRMERESRFEPPNFGEQPETDERLVIPVLHLREAIVVCPEAGEHHPIPPLSEIQLNFVSGRIAATGLYGREIVATGTLMRWITGYHHTPALLVVTHAAAKE